MKKSTKAEQLFMLIMICIGLFGVMSLSGCGGCSMEWPKCGSVDENGISLVGVSIPGCGGCFSSGRGCGSCLWSQSIKLSGGCFTDTTGKDEEIAIKYAGCNDVYYGGCCGMGEGACYGGVVAMDINNWGVFLGNDDGGGSQSERVCGVLDGCGACLNTDQVIKNELEIMQELIDIN